MGCSLESDRRSGDDEAGFRPSTGVASTGSSGGGVEGGEDEGLLILEIVVVEVVNSVVFDVSSLLPAALLLLLSPMPFEIFIV